VHSPETIFMSVMAVAFAAALFILVMLIMRSRKDQTITMPANTQIQPACQSIEDLVRAGRKIEAIKLLRVETGLGLKEAKDQIDALFSRR
jgi:ribosomal protein L7/L12